MNFKKIISFCLLIFVFTCFLKADRIDSFSIIKTEIHLKVKNFSQKKLNGHVVHHINQKQNSNYLEFDLANSLIVDSVFLEENKIAFIKTGEKLKVNLSSSNLNNYKLKIFYQGTPAADPSGWGGFYFNGDYAFNLGVGFQVNPHSFGRAWFPCVDEFTMKSAYYFKIETDSGYVAACNGVLKNENKTGKNWTFEFEENFPLSAYLASVSVSKYSIVKSNFNDLPIWLYALSNDTIKVKQSFEKLPQTIALFEQAFGPQFYAKVGYNFVPFNVGAMEHAGNITYPKSMADGSFNYEKLMAHELAHHWWGNNVTCNHERDMWLNEGWASYCEHYFMEGMYGKTAYLKSISDNHNFVLRLAHINDGQVFSMTDIPTTQTYGTHVYKKGASVVHSLRSLMGDSLFFIACKNYQTSLKNGNASSTDIKNIFSNNGQNIQVSSFFDNWVFKPGFLHAKIQKIDYDSISPNNFKAKIYIKQQTRFAEHNYSNQPIEIFFFKDEKNSAKHTLTLQNTTDYFEINLNFKPALVCLDFDEKLCDAITDKNFEISNTQTITSEETFIKIIPKTVNSSSFFRVEHHWVGPERYRTSQPLMSNYRYFTFDGIWENDFVTDIEITYDGRGIAGLPTSYLDHTLGILNEDSLVVLYRPYPEHPWMEVTSLTWNKGNKTDKFGRVILHQIKKGDYVLAFKNPLVSITDVSTKINNLNIKPNPADNNLEIEFNNQVYEEDFIQIINLKGEVVNEISLTKDTIKLEINTKNLSSGTYIILYQGKGVYSDKKVQITH